MLSLIGFRLNYAGFPAMPNANPDLYLPAVVHLYVKAPQ